MTGTTTLIRGGWIVAFDGERHRILSDGAVVYRDDSIVHVGRSWQEPVDVTVDARRHLVMPGLINAHAHVGAHTGDRMILDGGRCGPLPVRIHELLHRQGDQRPDDPRF